MTKLPRVHTFPSGIAPIWALTCALLWCTAVALDMKQIAVLHTELFGPMPCGRINGRTQMYCVRTPVSDTMIIFEYEPGDSFHRINTNTLAGYHIWAFGDGDGDSLMELLIQGDPDSADNASDVVLESPDRASFPSRIVWHITDDGQYHYTKYADMFRDGHKEIVMRTANGIIFYENTGDDSYDSVAGPILGAEDFCFGDFDADSLTDMILPQYGDSGAVSVLEATGHGHEIVLVWAETTHVACYYLYPCALGDLKGDGRPMFAILGIDSQSYGVLSVYQATGVHTYHQIWQTRVGFGGETPILAGDVDGDGINEVVVNDGGVIVYKYTGSNTFARIWELPPDSGFGQMNVFDVNGDGRGEIVLSAADHTSIYEDADAAIQEFKPCRPSIPVEAPMIVRGPFRFGGLPEQSVVELYSANGELVRRQSIGQSAGWTWDLTDQHGRRVPAGTYFVLIRCQGQTASTKLCVVN